MNSRVMDTFDALELSALQRQEAATRDKVRVVVQVSHCTLAVGADQLAKRYAESLPDYVHLIIGGCDGACFAAPQATMETEAGEEYRLSSAKPESALQGLDGFSYNRADSPVGKFLDGQRRVTMEFCGQMDATSVDEYIVYDGYRGLARALSMPPEAVIEEVKASGLRGRGGAYFPAALKWQGARNVSKTPRYLVVNAEEGEPGIFKDRHLMEGVPHRIIEGAIIAAYAAGASEAYFYINAEANLSAERMQIAVDQAYQRGLLGDNILGSGFSLKAEIRRGAGGYVCGEETTLLNTMEGYRREPRLRPPFPTEAGLWAKPTVINNVETLASVPFIMANGAQAYAAIGTETDKGAKMISLSGSVKRPGVIEVPMGTTLRQIIYDIGGGPLDGHTLTAIAVGGPSSGIFPVSMLDTPIKPGFLHSAGVMLGAGGVIALDERVSVLETVRKLAAYNAAESCGKCTPCREGTPRMVETIDHLMSGQAAASDIEDLRQLAQTINAASLCGLGQAAGNPILSALEFFGDEMFNMAGNKSA